MSNRGKDKKIEKEGIGIKVFFNTMGTICCMFELAQPSKLITPDRFIANFFRVCFISQLFVTKLKMLCDALL